MSCAAPSAQESELHRDTQTCRCVRERVGLRNKQAQAPGAWFSHGPAPRTSHPSSWLGPARSCAPSFACNGTPVLRPSLWGLPLPLTQGDPASAYASAVPSAALYLSPGPWQGSLQTTACTGKDPALQDSAWSRQLREARWGPYTPFPVFVKPFIWTELKSTGDECHIRVPL